MSFQSRPSSLREYDRLPDRLRLHRQADPRAILVVEGESDRRLMREVVGDSAAVVFVGGTRVDVLAVAAAVSPMGIDRVACMVDRDFDDLVQAAIDIDLPVVAYDGADLEDMLMWSPAARRAIEELASDNKLAAYGLGALLDRVRDQAAPLGRLRRGNAVNLWGLIFDEIDLRSKVDATTLELNVLGVCMALAGTTEAPPSVSDLQEVARNGECPICPRTGRRMSRGRDQLALVGAALRRLIGTCTKDQTDPYLLGAVVRSAASPGWLRSTDWFGRISTLAELH